ncbi:Conserved_hypothetical protein [Hexamita inflata]|uniref:Uncharacterized protein n=1 Tax=Hexamita inflata TaxID=28002 RepID=A0AA86QTW3_9EUKA|nr:Conserved hypothetical protein [Hexamita inflata]
MVGKCPEWMHYCYSGKAWSTATLSIGGSAMFVVVVTVLVLFILFLKNLHKLLHMRQHYKIFATTFVCAALRIPWWVMNMVTYKDNSPPAIAIQMLNRICMLALYLSQSFYVQTWLRVIIALRQYKGERALKIFFMLMDSVVSILLVIELIYRAFDTQGRNDNGKYSPLYNVGIDVIAGGCLLTCFVYVIVGTILFYKLKHYYTCCSTTIIGFISVSILLSSASLLRFVSLTYHILSGEHMNDNQYAIQCYLIPDIIPSFTITIVQVTIYRSERKKRVRLNADSEDITPYLQ